MATETVEDKHGTLQKRPERLSDHLAVISTARLTADDMTPHPPFVRDIEAWAVELAGPSPSPLLQSSSMTVALCEHDVRARQALNPPMSNNGERQRNLDRAMKRYLSAVKALAVVQRTRIPSAQVNIAEQQVVSKR